MDILDLFDWENNSKKNHNQNDYTKNKKHNKSEFWEMDMSNIIGNLWNYKKFIPMIVIIGIVLIIIVIIGIIWAFPYLKSFVGNIDQSGIKSIVESGMNYVDEKWLKWVIESWNWVLDKLWNWNGG